MRCSPDSDSSGIASRGSRRNVTQVFKESPSRDDSLNRRPIFMARAKKSAASRKTAKPVPAARPVEAVVALGRNCGIREGAELHKQLLAQLNCAEPVTIDIAAVERIDTAAIQLLYAFERARLAAGRELRWRGASETLAQALAVLGLTLPSMTTTAH